jgi:nitrogen fixation NifU-like protein
MELDSLYQEVILEHYKRPLHKSLKADPTIQVQHINTSCGDEITLNLHTDGKVVQDITWVENQSQKPWQLLMPFKP